MNEKKNSYVNDDVLCGVKVGARGELKFWNNQTAKWIMELLKWNGVVALVEVERTATAVGNLKRSEVSELVFGKRKQRNGQQIYFPSLFASILIDENGILYTFWYGNVDLK